MIIKNFRATEESEAERKNEYHYSFGHNLAEVPGNCFSFTKNKCDPERKERFLSVFSSELLKELSVKLLLTGTGERQLPEQDFIFGCMRWLGITYRSMDSKSFTVFVFLK